MEEDVSRLLGTEERLEKFATEYVNLPALWNKNDEKYKKKSARATARRRLARALGLGGGGGPGGAGGAGGGVLLARAIHEFRARLQKQVVNACAEAARRGGAEGGSWGAARDLLPRWARVAACCLPQSAAPSAALEVPVPKPADNPTSAMERAALMRRIVRGVRRAARSDVFLGARTFRRVAADLQRDVAVVQDLWSSMQRSALAKLRARAWRCDTGAPLSAFEWAVVDLAITCGGVMLLNTLHYQQYKSLRGLLGVFHLVQRFELEPAPGEPPPTPHQWVKAAHWYSRDQGRAVMSAVALQRRWFELRADTRRRLQAAWRRRGRVAGGPPEPEPDAKDKVLALHEAIARRYPHVVTEALPTWSHMLHTNQLAPPTNECGPAPGETVPTSALSDSDSDAPGSDRVSNGDKTKAQKSDSEVVTDKPQFSLQAIGTPDCNPKNLEEADLKITNSDGNRDLRLEKNAAPVKPDPKTKNSTNDNVDFTDSDGDLQIDESRDPSEDVVKALQKMNPRTVQTTIVFVSDEEDAPNDAGEEIIQTKRTNKIQTKKVERPKEDKNSPVVKRESIKENADPSSKKKSCVKADSDCNNDNESHKRLSQKVVSLRNDSSDSDDDVLVIDDCKEDENDDLRNADRITAAIEQEMFRDTSNGSSNKDEVKSRDDSSTAKLSNAVDPNSTVPSDQNPILSHLLTSKYDDVFKRYHAITNKDTISKSLTAESVPKRDIKQEYAMNIKNELLGQSASASNEEIFEGGIDPKLLMYPVVLLTKLEDVRPKQLPEPPKLQTFPPRTAKLSPRLLANKRHIETLSTLSETFFSIKKNIELLKVCQPCVVMLTRGEEKRSRVSKRVELPDIEEVRRNNKRMLTAQVAPLAHQKIAGSKRGAGGEGPAPSPEELQRLLDDFADATPERAVCKNRNSGSAASCDCGQCVWRLLAAPPASGAVSKVQARLLLRTATLAKQRRKYNAEKERRRAAQRKKRPSPPPPPPPAPRAPSPYDAERAAREWLREKNVAAEKFGVKPRCFKKKPSAGAATDVATLTPLPPRAGPVPDPAPDRATLTLNDQKQISITVNQATSGRPPLSSDSAVPAGVTVTPVQTPSGLTYLPLSEENLIREAQNQPIFKLTPSLFNFDAVADINKKLEHLASNERPDAPAEHTFSPIITNVQSLAREERPAELKVQQICYLTKKSDESVSSQKESRPYLTVTSSRLKDQTVPKIVISKSQLRALSAQPPGPPDPRSLLHQRLLSDAAPRGNTADGTASQLPNRTNVVLTNSSPRAQPAGLVSNDAPNQLNETPPGPARAAPSQDGGQAPPSLQLNSVYSGPSLTGSLQTPWIVTSVQPATPSIVVGAPSSISQTTFENLTTPFGLNLNQNVLQVNSVQAGPPPALSAVQVGSQLQLVLTAPPVNALQPGHVALMQPPQQMQSVPLNWDANALQVNSVRSAPGKSTGTTGFTVTNGQASQDRPGPTLQLNSVQAGPQASSKSPQIAFLTQEQIRGLTQLQQIKAVRQTGAGLQARGPRTSVLYSSVPQTSVPQASVPKASVTLTSVLQACIPKASVTQASVPKTSVMQTSVPKASVPQANVTQTSVTQASVPQANVTQTSVPQASVPQASVPPVVTQAGPSADKRKMTKEEYDDEVFNEADWAGLARPARVRGWAGRAGRAAPAVLAARRGCWRAARHLVLREAPAPPARAALYFLNPLTRLILDEDECSPAAKQSRPGAPPAAPAAPAAPAPRPWLKVKAFAKMVDDGEASQTTSHPTPEAPGAGPGAGAGAGPGAGAGAGPGAGAGAGRYVVQDGVVYLRLCDHPPVKAKVLSPVSGLREACALLLRRAPLFLYAPHRAALAPLAGELDAQGSSIVLTGPADMSEALGALALMLNPSGVAREAPTSPPAKDPPADDNVVNVTGPKSFPAKQSRPNHKLSPPKVVLNPQSSVDLSVKAVRVAGDSDQETYHLILNDVQSGSVTRRKEGEPRTLGGVIDVSSDEGELSV